MSYAPKLEAVQPHERLTVFINWAECHETIQQLIKLQSDLRGVVIVAVSPPPDCKLYFVSRCKLLQQIGDDRKSEDPKQYRSLIYYLNELERQIDEREGERTELAFKWSLGWWEHPESDRVPLERYLRITGSLFPGSPTQ